MGLARIYIGDESLEVVKETLEEVPYLRIILSSHIELRYTLELSFLFDNYIEYGQNTERILNKII